jgi:ketosteroid isomerase-like protein
MKWLALFAAMVSGCAPSVVAPRGATADVRAEVEQALGVFLHAFENLAWEPFRASFADDACVFFPAGRKDRACGREAVEATFREVFAAERRGSSRVEPPYLDLRPEDLVVQVLGGEAAIATFHLRNDERLARRTIAFERRAGRWLIVHLHASNVPAR